LGEKQPDLSIETSKRPSFSSKLPKRSSLAFLVSNAVVSKLDPLSKDHGEYCIRKRTLYLLWSLQKPLL